MSNDSNNILTFDTLISGIISNNLDTVKKIYTKKSLQY